MRRVFFIFLLFTFHLSLFTAVQAKVYIDITSPAAAKVPLAIYDLSGAAGKEISGILRDDLVFTGLFTCVDKAAYIESVSQPFSAANWTSMGIEAVVKGSVTEDKGLTVSIRLFDVTEGKEILHKEYQAEKDLARPLAHTIANDIYTVFTGQQGIFRSRIMFVGERRGAKDLYLSDWDGHRSRKLGLKASIILSPHWSSDGNRAVYSSERARRWGIYLLDFKKMTERRIFVSKGTNLAGDFFPDKNAFVFSSSKEGSPDLYIYQIDTGKLRRLTSSFGIEVSPAVSPDGGAIAFVSDRGGSPQIYLMRSDGSEVRRVTFEGNYNTSPAWSPKGDRIAFSGRRGGKNQICIVKPDGSELIQLTDRGNNEDPSFSPDGRYLSFTSDRDGAKGVYIMRANGESQERVTPKDLKAFGPRWSPR
ncbi:MAG: Tol-Pal system beta propeller repeat protein TolB [Nitrospiraceae bacterium]|nr:Tol-Pal system beta propeller repeat protein TolB [Nitrospiraceae bacterium]